MYQAYPTNPAVTTRLANAYGSLAWYHLFNRQFAEAVWKGGKGGIKIKSVLGFFVRLYSQAKNPNTL